MKEKKMAADSYTALVAEFEKSAEATQSGDLTRVSRLALRDGAIALAALSFWAAADAWYAATGLSAAALLSVLDGIAAGAVLGLLAHEWGHFAGARWGGGIAPTTRFTQLFPIFVLDMHKSPERAFRAMSVGGNAAHWSLVVALFLWVPLDAPGRVALACGAFGFAFGASLTEVPIMRRSFAGASPVESFEGLTGAKLRRDRWIGIAAGAVLFAMIV
jgi:hypothetical protein